MLWSAIERLFPDVIKGGQLSLGVGRLAGLACVDEADFIAFLRWLFMPTRYKKLSVLTGYTVCIWSQCSVNLRANN